MEGPAEVPGTTASEEERVEGRGSSVYLGEGGMEVHKEVDQNTGALDC